MAIKTILIIQLDMHIFMDNLNNIFLMNNYIQHPSSQHHHLNKLHITKIVHKICWTPHKIHLHKVRAHSAIIGNEMIEVLANEGTHKDKPSIIAHIHIAHPTPYWLASCMTATHDVAIHNLHTFIDNEHMNQESFATKNKYPTRNCRHNFLITYGKPRV